MADKPSLLEWSPGEICFVTISKDPDTERYHPRVEVGRLHDPCGQADGYEDLYIDKGIAVLVVSDRNTFRQLDTLDDDVLVLAPDLGLVWIRATNLRKAHGSPR